MAKGKVVRISDEMVRRIAEYQRQFIQNKKKAIKFTEASREFALNSVSNLDDTKDGLKRIGNWRFKI